MTAANDELARSKRLCAVGFCCADVYKKLDIFYPTGNGIDWGVHLARAGVPVTLARDDFSELPELLARRMFANPELLPLAVLLDCRAGEPAGLFARGGYAVGSVELMLRLAALA